MLTHEGTLCSHDALLPGIITAYLIGHSSGLFERRRCGWAWFIRPLRFLPEQERPHPGQSQATRPQRPGLRHPWLAPASSRPSIISSRFDNVVLIPDTGSYHLTEFSVLMQEISTSASFPVYRSGTQAVQGSGNISTGQAGSIFPESVGKPLIVQPARSSLGIKMRRCFPWCSWLFSRFSVPLFLPSCSLFSASLVPGAVPVGFLLPSGMSAFSVLPGVVLSAFPCVPGVRAVAGVTASVSRSPVCWFLVSFGWRGISVRLRFVAGSGAERAGLLLSLQD